MQSQSQDKSGFEERRPTNGSASRYQDSKAQFKTTHQKSQRMAHINDLFLGQAEDNRPIVPRAGEFLIVSSSQKVVPPQVSQEDLDKILRQSSTSLKSMAASTARQSHGMNPVLSARKSIQRMKLESPQRDVTDFNASPDQYSQRKLPKSREGQHSRQGVRQDEDMITLEQKQNQLAENQYLRTSLTLNVRQITQSRQDSQLLTQSSRLVNVPERIEFDFNCFKNIELNSLLLSQREFSLKPKDNVRSFISCQIVPAFFSQYLNHPFDFLFGRLGHGQ